MALAMNVHPDDLTSAPQSDAPAPVTPEAARTAVLPTYKRSIEMASGEGVWLTDTEGKRYLDFVSGIAVNALGYGDAGLIATMRDAASGLLHVSNLYWTAPAVRLAAEIGRAHV